jgi:hypothetical protein
MAKRDFTRLVVLLATGVLASACAAPTLPTPPPSAAVALIGTDAVVTGLADASALVSCLNEATGRGVIETADAAGNFVITLPAERGDHLTLWQDAGNGPGQVLDLIVPAAAP